MAVRKPTAGPGDIWGSPEDEPEDEWQDLSEGELIERRELAAQERVDRDAGR